MILNNSLVYIAAAKIPEGTPLTIPESLSVALFCISVVFVVLACLFILIKIFSVGVRFIESRALKATPPTASISSLQSNPSEAAENQDFSSGTLRLKNVDEPTAAMIMAIVSDESGIPLSELCFKSIQKKSDETAK